MGVTKYLYELSESQIVSNNFLGHLLSIFSSLDEGFEILCTDYHHMLEKREDIIQGRTLFKKIR